MSPSKIFPRTLQSVAGRGAWPTPYLQRELLGEFGHVRSPGLLLVQGYDHEVLKKLPLLVLDQLPVQGWVSRSLLQP